MNDQEHRTLQLTPSRFFGRRNTALTGTRGQWGVWFHGGGMRDVVIRLVVGAVIAATLLYLL